MEPMWRLTAAESSKKKIKFVRFKVCFGETETGRCRATPPPNHPQDPPSMGGWAGAWAGTAAAKLKQTLVQVSDSSRSASSPPGTTITTHGNCPARSPVK